MQRDEIGFAQQLVERHVGQPGLALLGSPACAAASSRARACRSRGRGAPPPCRCSPPPPIRPMVLPQTNEPSRWRDCPPGNLPARTRRSPSTMRRATASISPKVRSAVASVVDRRHHRDRNAARGRLGDVDVGRRDRLRRDMAQLRIGGDHRAVDLVVQQAEQDVALAHGRDQRRLGMMRLSSGLTLTLATVRRRSSALSATGWVTKMRGRFAHQRSTARCRRRRRPRPASRRECRRWRRARRAPSGCRARARARPDARSSRRARPPRRRRAAGCG